MPSTNSLPETLPPQNPFIRIHKYIRTEKPRKQKYPWLTGSSGEIKICDMDDLHLVRTVKFLERDAGAKYPYQQPYVHADVPLPATLSRRGRSHRFSHWEKSIVIAYECMILEIWYRKIAVPPGNFVNPEDLQGSRLGFEPDGEDLAPIRPSCTELIKNYLTKEYIINQQMPSTRGSGSFMWVNPAIEPERRTLISAIIRAGLNDTDFIEGCAKVNTWINTAHLDNELSTEEKRAYLDILVSLRHRIPGDIRRQIQLDDERRHIATPRHVSTQVLEHFYQQLGQQSFGLEQWQQDEITQRASQQMRSLQEQEAAERARRSRARYEQEMDRVMLHMLGLDPAFPDAEPVSVQQVGDGLYFSSNTHQEILIHGSNPFNVQQTREELLTPEEIARQDSNTVSWPSEVPLPDSEREAVIDLTCRTIHDEMREDMERVFGIGYIFNVEAHVEHPDPMAIVIKVRHVNERSWSHEFYTLQELKSFINAYLNPTTPPPPEPTRVDSICFVSAGGWGYGCEVLSYTNSYNDPRAFRLNVRYPLPESILEGDEAVIGVRDGRTFRCKILSIDEVNRCSFTIENLINL